MVDFLQDFASAFYFLKFFGLAPFSFEKGVAVTTFFDGIYSLFISTTFLAMFVTLKNFLEEYQFIAYQSPVLFLSWKFLYIYVITSKLLCVCYSFIKRGDLSKIIKHVEKSDRRVGISKIPSWNSINPFTDGIDQSRDL